MRSLGTTSPVHCTPIIEHQTPSGGKMCFSQLWRLGRLWSRCQRIQCPDSQTAPSLCCPHTEGAREVSGVRFIRALNPFMEPPPSWSNQFPKAPSPNTVTLGIRFQHMNQRWEGVGETHSVCGSGKAGTRAVFTPAPGALTVNMVRHCSVYIPQLNALTKNLESSCDTKGKKTKLMDEAGASRGQVEFKSQWKVLRDLKGKAVG